MTSICFYFQVHQPFRMRPYRVLDIGSGLSYFDDEKNREVCRKVAEKCYLPANKLMLELITKYPGQFKISYSISGVALEQFAEYAPEVLKSFQALAATGQVEFLAETYYHSLTSLFDVEEFTAQVKQQLAAIKKYFKQTPTTFRNTELIYSNAIAALVEKLGFTAMLAEGADHVLEWRSPHRVYSPVGTKNLRLLLKSYKLSDDIAFRFSQRDWPAWPLTPQKFATWVHDHADKAETINLFMDYETFGEHQWEDTGIFEFLRELPAAVLKHKDFDFALPREVATRYTPVSTLDVPHPTSWADQERDLSAWLGNPMQDSSIAWLYQLGKAVKASKRADLLHTWRKLQTSDHFYYMCTKFWSDGDVHKYFSSYNTPHEAYVYIGNILTDLEMQLGDLASVSGPVGARGAHRAPATNPHRSPRTSLRPKQVTDLRPRVSGAGAQD